MDDFTSFFSDTIEYEKTKIQISQTVKFYSLKSSFYDNDRFIKFFIVIINKW